MNLTTIAPLVLPMVTTRRKVEETWRDRHFYCCCVLSCNSQESFPFLDYSAPFSSPVERAVLPSRRDWGQIRTLSTATKDLSRRTAHGDSSDRRPRRCARPARLIEISSPNNQTVRALQRLSAERQRYRRKHPSTIVLGGRRLVSAALDFRRWIPDTILCTHSEAKWLRNEHEYWRDIYVANEDIVRRALPPGTTRLEPLVAAGPCLQQSLWSNDNTTAADAAADAAAATATKYCITRAVYLDVQDPANMGAIVRTAVALGVCDFFLGPNACDPFGPLALRTSAGAAFGARFGTCSDALETVERATHLNLPIFTAEASADAIADGMKRKCSANSYTLLPQPPPQRFLLVMGHETRGVDPVLSAHATPVHIPLAGSVVNCLGVAAASAILLDHFTVGSR